MVAHHFELVFLPPGDAALDQDLGDRARGEAALGETAHLGAVVRNTRTAASEDVRGPDDDRVAHVVGHLQRLFERVRDTRRRRMEPDLRHRDLEPLAILGRADRFDVGADHLHVVFLEHTGFVQLDREIEARLAAEGRQ